MGEKISELTSKMKKKIVKYQGENWKYWDLLPEEEEEGEEKEEELLYNDLYIDINIKEKRRHKEKRKNN